MPYRASAVAGRERRRWPLRSRKDRDKAGGGRGGEGAPQGKGEIAAVAVPAGPTKGTVGPVIAA